MPVLILKMSEKEASEIMEAVKQNGTIHPGNDVCLSCDHIDPEACETCAGGTTLDDNTLIPMTDGEKHCRFCEDYDEFSQIVCYLPTDNGGCIPVPMNRCPVCGADMTGGGAK